MLRNYILIAWRNLNRQRMFSLINGIGLAIGMAASLLMMEYVAFEMNFDRFHDHAEDIYRVTNDRYQNGVLVQHGTITYPMVGPEMKVSFPEVVQYTRLMPFGRAGMKMGEKVFQIEQVNCADENFLQLFDYPLLAGDRITALKEINSIAISATVAESHFDLNGTDYSAAIGQIMEMGSNRTPCKVTAVFADVPQNSHLQFDGLISYSTLIAMAGENANSSNQWSDFYHYVRLQPGTDPKTLESKFPAFSQLHFDGDDTSFSDEQFALQPLEDAHLYSDFEYEIGIVGNGKVVWALFLIAIFILFIAWINFINLSTARAMERAKEVGVRKVLGAVRGQLIWQFLLESFLLNFFALGIAFTLVQGIQPWFNDWLEMDFSLTRWLLEGGFVPQVWLAVLGAGMIISGLYPAFVLSGYQPVKILKGRFARSEQGIMLRKGLVVFQFVCSICLIGGTLAVYVQLSHMQNQSLGMDLEQTVVLEGPYLSQWDSTFIERIETFKAEAKKNAAVHQVTTSHRLPGQRLPRYFHVKSTRSNPDELITVSRINIDHEFAEVYGLELLTGRDFRADDHNSNGDLINSIMVNATAANLLGYEDPKEMVGTNIFIGGRPWEVVGVLADFHQRSLKYPIEPIVFQPFYSTEDFYSLKISPQNIEPTLVGIQETYESLFPGNPFTYFFMDERFEAQYKQDKIASTLFLFFSGLVILIACLGLLGLSAYSVLQRSKEISIRKVLGASISQIWMLLSREVMGLIIVANFLAIPITYFGIREWMSGYSFPIDLHWGFFILPFLLVMVIALVTLSTQIIRAANQNPVDTLRHE